MKDEERESADCSVISQTQGECVPTYNSQKMVAERQWYMQILKRVQKAEKVKSYRFRSLHFCSEGGFRSFDKEL